MSIRGLDNRIIIINKYIILIIFINRLVKGVTRTTYFIIEIYLVNNLKVNLFINNNIIVL